VNPVTTFIDCSTLDINRVEPAADSLTTFDDDDFSTLVVKYASRSESGCSSTDHDHRPVAISSTGGNPVDEGVVVLTRRMRLAFGHFSSATLPLAVISDISGSVPQGSSTSRLPQDAVTGLEFARNSILFVSSLSLVGKTLAARGLMEEIVVGGMSLLRLAS